MLRVHLRSATESELRETTKDKIDIACGNNEKCLVLYHKAVFI